MAPACILALILDAAMGGDARVFPAFVLGGVISAFLPCYFSHGIAKVSTSCQDLLEHLNAVRIKDLGQHPRLIALETALRNLNREQGLGIVVAGILFDTDFIKRLLFFIASMCTTIAPILLANFHHVHGNTDANTDSSGPH
eukprot:COSAG02_NODE_704_length_18279_cov_100.299560_3_plen_141_part_00